MPNYDVRCSDCGSVHERSKSFFEQKRGDLVTNDPCVCGGHVEIIVTQVNLSSDCTPTRGYGRSANAPNLIRSDGSAINPGHESITSRMLGLNKDQEKRLGL